MLLSAINKRIKAIKNAGPGYISALTSGYVLMVANIFVQFILTPFYLKHLGENQFGLLMMLLNMSNFAAIGITWMSGGLVRVFGEYWVKSDISGFRDAFVVGKYVFTLYALFVVTIAFTLWLVIDNVEANEESFVAVGLLACLYFVLNYEALPERQAFVGTNQQTRGNQIELVRTIFFAGLTYLLLPQLQNMSAVWIALMSGVLLQRLISGQYWKRYVSETGWKRFTPEMKPIMKRLAGKQGIGYVSYGALLLILQADTMIVGFIGGATAAGQFVLLWKIPEAIGLFIWKIPSTMEPRVIQLDASEQYEKLNVLYTNGRRWFFLLVATVALIYIISGQFLAELWVGEHAPQERWMYIACGIAFFFNTFARWPVSFSYALVKLVPLTKIAAIEVFCKLILTIILFRHFNIAAPIIASIITHICYATLAYQRIIKPVGHAL